MKKLKLFLLALLLFVAITPNVKAEEASAKSEINVYIFKGDGCGFCANALSFFESIEEEYGNYFKLVEYEVWNNQENAALMNDIAEYLGVTISGVPFIIIGDQTYPGFQESWGEEIKAKILSEYNLSADRRTDVIKNFQSGKKVDNPRNTKILVISVVALVGVIGFVTLARRNVDEEIVETVSEKAFDKISKHVTEDNNDVEEEVVVEKKKTKKNDSKKDIKEDKKNATDSKKKNTNSKKKKKN